MKRQEKTPEERIQEADVPKEEQPWHLPAGWKWVRLEDVAEIIMGQSPAGVDTTDDNQFTPLIGGAADMGDLYPKATRFTKKAMKVSKPDDIIINIRATLGRPIFSDGIYCLGRGVAAIRPFWGLKEFYRFLIISFERYLYEHATGSTFLQVTGKTLNNMPIPLPPLDVQKAIVEKIESLFASLDRAETLVDEALAAAPLRRAATLHQAFQGDLTRPWRQKQGTSKAEWRRMTLGNVAKWGSGGTPSRKNPAFYTGDIPWVKTGELQDDYIVDTEEKITPEAIDLSSAKMYPINTVIIAMYGATIGKTGILKVEATTNQACACAVCKDDIYYRFLFYYLQSQKSTFIKIGKGGAQPNLSQNMIKAFPIVLPPMAEQEEIVRRLDRLLAGEDKARAAAEKVKAAIAAMKTAILHRAFQGAL